MFFRKKKPKAEKKPSREELIAQAQENARRARENIGEETLERIAAAMAKKEQSATEQAKAKIREMDKAHVADHLKLLIEDK